MTRPSDIPEDVWGIARELVGRPISYAPVEITHAIAERIARALMTYGQRRADEATEKAAQVCEERAKAFLLPEYASGQPMSSLAERFACSECATAIRSGK